MDVEPEIPFFQNVRDSTPSVVLAMSLADVIRVIVAATSGEHMASSLLVPFAILGRVLLALIFVLSPLVNLIPNFGATVATMGQAGVPLPSFALAFAIMLSLVGGVLLSLGFHARIGALLLIAFLLPATYFFHAPWAASPANVGEQTVHFLKNLGLLGAMLLVVAVGSGPGSLDRRQSIRER